MEFSSQRTEEILKKVVCAYVKKGNVIVTDGWSGYNYISRVNSGYSHSIHNHGHGDFGVGLDSTSHIEGIWSRLKTILKQIYYVIPNEYIHLFIREAGFRIKVNSVPTENQFY